MDLNDDPIGCIFGFLLIGFCIYFLGICEIWIWKEFGKPMGFLSIIVLIYLLIKYSNFLEEGFEFVVGSATIVTYILLFGALIFVFIKWLFN